VELRDHFGAVSWETGIIRGIWTHAGQTFADDLVRVFVDVPDLPEHRLFFIEFKERLKGRFSQLDIWVTSHALDAL
jgi:hypothetical protein